MYWCSDEVYHCFCNFTSFVSWSILRYLRWFLLSFVLPPPDPCPIFFFFLPPFLFEIFTYPVSLKIGGFID